MRRVIGTWVLRIMLVLILLPHGLGKLGYLGTFTSKFDLTATVGLLTGAAELAAVVGFVAGGLLAHSRHTTAAYTVTVLAALAVWIVQIGAIALVHWPTWLYFNGGMEFNVAILAMSAVVVLWTPSPLYDKTGR